MEEQPHIPPFGNFPKPSGFRYRAPLGPYFPQADLLSDKTSTPTYVRGKERYLKKVNWGVTPDTYTKAEVDAMLSGISTQGEVEDQIRNKADNYYTKEAFLRKIR